jgi:hypothetical protein
MFLSGYPSKDWSVPCSRTSIADGILMHFWALKRAIHKTSPGHYPYWHRRGINLRCISLIPTLTFKTEYPASCLLLLSCTGAKFPQTHSDLTSRSLVPEHELSAALCLVSTWMGDRSRTSSAGGIFYALRMHNIFCPLSLVASRGYQSPLCLPPFPLCSSKQNVKYIKEISLHNPTMKVEVACTYETLET